MAKLHCPICGDGFKPRKERAAFERHMWRHWTGREYPLQLEAEDALAKARERAAIETAKRFVER